jgi:hypothetical protein
MRELTTRQSNFLKVLFDEAGGDYSRAKVLAGYSENSSTTEIVRSMKDEILELTKEYLAVNAPRAANALVSVLQNPAELGNQHRLNAAKEMLDRIGIQKTDKVEVSAPQGIMLLPPKEHGIQ